MSVRPITESERRQAIGMPFTNWLILFGATQGLLTHLHAHKITLQGKWFPSGLSRSTMPLFVIGGALIGGAIGVKFFGDDQLRRLAANHSQDRHNKIESVKYTPLFDGRQ